MCVRKERLKATLMAPIMVFILLAFIPVFLLFLALTYPSYRKEKHLYPDMGFLDWLDMKLREIEFGGI